MFSRDNKTCSFPLPFPQTWISGWSHDAWELKLTKQLNSIEACVKTLAERILLPAGGRPLAERLVRDLPRALHAEHGLSPHQARVRHHLLDAK